MEELRAGYESNAELRSVFDSMGLNKEDVEALLVIADEDGSGDVDYTEFSDLIVKLKSTDIKSMLMLTKQDLARFKKEIASAVSHLKEKCEMILDRMPVKGRMVNESTARVSARSSYSNCGHE